MCPLPTSKHLASLLISFMALFFLASQNNVWIQEPAAKSWHQLFNNSLVTCTDFSSTCAPQWQEKLQYVLP
jgi:hypothetical protein